MTTVDSSSARRGGRGRALALAVVVLGALLLAVAWLLGLYGTEGDQRDAIHVFQYCLLLVVAAGIGAALEPASGYALLGLAAIGTAMTWLGLDNPRLLAVLIALVALAGCVAGILTRTRVAGVVAVLTTSVSLLGLLLIL